MISCSCLKDREVFICVFCVLRFVCFLIQHDFDEVTLIKWLWFWWKYYHKSGCVYCILQAPFNTEEAWPHRAAPHSMHAFPWLSQTGILTLLKVRGGSWSTVRLCWKVSRQPQNDPEIWPECMTLGREKMKALQLFLKEMHFNNALPCTLNH